MTRFYVLLASVVVGTALGVGCGESFATKGLHDPNGGSSGGDASTSSGTGDQGGGVTASASGTGGAANSTTASSSGSGGASSSVASGSSGSTGSGGAATTGSTTTVSASAGSGTSSGVGGASSSSGTGDGGPVCSEGAHSCDVNGVSPLVCTNGMWVSAGPDCTYGCNSNGLGTCSCSEGTYSCSANGVSPLVCVTGTWVSAGGDCTYGCTTNGFGTCSCTAPAGRFTVESKEFTTSTGFQNVFDVVNDSMTGLNWVSLNGCFNLSACQTQCASYYGGVLPTMTQLQTLLAEQVPATECNAPDVDPYLSNQPLNLSTQYQGDGRPANYTPCTLPSGGLGFQYLEFWDGTISCLASPGSGLCLVP